MKSTLSSVLAASMATGAYAAAHYHAAHHRHHAREAVAAPQDGVDWANVQYTWSNGQCFGDYGCNPTTSDAGPAATSAAAVAPAAPTSTSADFVDNAIAQASSAVAAPASQVESAVSQATSAVGSITSGGGAIDVSKILATAAETILAASNDGSCAEDDSLPNVMEISNQSGDDFVWLCWGSAGSWVNSVAPIMAVGISSGSSKTVSFADTPSGAQGGACAPFFSGTSMANGQVKNTWLESTFNQWGTVDVSREVSITGHSISAQLASGCKTDMDTCVFKCNNSDGDPSTPGQCGAAGSYSLVNCSGSNANASPSDTADGGCQFGSGKATVTVGPMVNSY